MQCDAEVDCQKDGPDSLKAVSDLFPSNDTSSQVLTDFYTELLQAMRSILNFEEQIKLKHFQEQSLVKFHTLKICKLPYIWHTHSVGLKLPPVNAFQQQAVNRHQFEKLLIDAVKSRTTIAPAPKPRLELTIEEDNSIRYASGYVAMKLLHKYKKMTTDNAVHFVECLSNMASLGEEASFYDYTLEWMSSIDRGGLFYVNNSTFSFFETIEIKTQELLPQHLATKRNADTHNKIKKIEEEDEVQFWWSMLAISIAEEDASAELLNNLISMWVTVRGFAVVSNWLEQYNISQKQSIKKSKRLRETLQQRTAL